MWPARCADGMTKVVSNSTKPESSIVPCRTHIRRQVREQAHKRLDALHTMSHVRRYKGRLVDVRSNEATLQLLQRCKCTSDHSSKAVTSLSGNIDKAVSSGSVETQPRWLPFRWRREGGDATVYDSESQTCARRPSAPHSKRQSSGCVGSQRHKLVTRTA